MHKVQRLADLKKILSEESIESEEEALRLLKLSGDIPSSDVSSNSYPFLSEDALSTSFFSYKRIFSKFSQKEEVVFCDLGAGFCKGALIAELFFSKIKTINIELHHERLEKMKELLLNSRHEFKNQNLELMNLPVADYYFIYLPTGALLNSVLIKLLSLSLTYRFSIIFIESHGDLIPFLERLKLLDINKTDIETFRPRHDNYIYSSPMPLDASSYLKEVFEIQHLIANKENFSVPRIEILLMIIHDLENYEMIVKTEYFSEWIVSIEKSSFLCSSKKTYLNTSFPKFQFDLSSSTTELISLRPKSVSLEYKNNKALRKIGPCGQVLDQLN